MSTTLSEGTDQTRSVDSALGAGESPPSSRGRLAHPRSGRVVIRRRRVLAVLLVAGSVCAGLIPALPGLRWGAGIFAVLAITYLIVVARVCHLHDRREMVLAFGGHDPTEVWDWTELGREIRLVRIAEAPDPAASPVEVNNLALGRFLLVYALGWALTPAVALIRLVRGDVSDVERNGLIGRIVWIQQYGRSHSLRLLSVGAVATVAVTTAGAVAATAFVSTASASAAPARRAYIVRPGDTLSEIAARFGTTVAALAKINHTADPDFIVPGQVLTIPGGVASVAANHVTYTVQAGDTLSAIAARYKTTVTALAAANHIEDPNLIFAGQVLTVSGGSASATAPPPSGLTPSPTTYKVQAGDTLGVIAARFGTTVAALAAANHIEDPNLIFAGQVLTLLHGPTVPPSGTPPAAPPPSSGKSTAGYVNPFRFGSWSPARTDQGVDWLPNVSSPVVAIGDGVVTYSSTSTSWPGGAFITYRLTKGSHAGFYIYVAEHLTNLLAVGTTVSAGHVIATALPGYPWTEWGWASPSGDVPAPSAQYNGAPGGTATPGGKAFARFLIKLGAKPLQNPGPGPDTP